MTDDYLRCDCCDKYALYRHWCEQTQMYDWFCEDDKCGDCEYVGMI